MRYILIRESEWQKKVHQVKGEIYVYHENKELTRVKSLELPWKENEVFLSCIPAGLYKGRRIISEKFGPVIWIMDVPGRTEILQHILNYIGSDNPSTNDPDSLGCIGPGMRYKDITGDGIVELVQSKKAHWEVLNNFDEGEEFDVIIKGIDDL